MEELSALLRPWNQLLEDLVGVLHLCVLSVVNWSGSFPDCDGGLVDVYSQCCPPGAIICDVANIQKCKNNPTKGHLLNQYTTVQIDAYSFMQVNSVHPPTHFHTRMEITAAEMLTSHLWRTRPVVAMGAFFNSMIKTAVWMDCVLLASWAQTRSVALIPWVATSAHHPILMLVPGVPSVQSPHGSQHLGEEVYCVTVHNKKIIIRCQNI